MVRHTESKRYVEQVDRTALLQDTFEVAAQHLLQELMALQNLGFAHADALTALRSTAGDADAAAELLLLSGAGADLAQAARAWCPECIVVMPKRRRMVEDLPSRNI